MEKLSHLGQYSYFLIINQLVIELLWLFIINLDEIVFFKEYDYVNILEFEFELVIWKNEPVDL